MKTYAQKDGGTVKLDFKNRQDKNQLGFKNQITNDQLGQISFKNRQDKNNLTLRTKMAVTKNVLKVKFDCMPTATRGGNIYQFLQSISFTILQSNLTLRTFFGHCYFGS